MGSEEEEKVLAEGAAGEDELPPPPEDAAEPSPSGKQGDAWKEDYEDLIEPEPVKKRKRAPFRHWGSAIVLVIVLILLIAWTVLSPPVLESVGDTYVSSEEVYASWGNYTGVRDIWSGNVTWGVSIRGTNTSDNSRSIELKVLVTKVSETTGNWFLRGTSVEMRNVSAYDENGTFLGAMIGHADLGYGAEATVPISLERNGTYFIFVKVSFLVYETMRIGYLPLETVQIEKAWVDFPIVVS